MPRKASLVMVSVDGRAETELEAAELRLGGRHKLLHRVMAADRRERIRVAGVLGEHLGNERAPCIGSVSFQVSI